MALGVTAKTVIISAVTAILVGGIGAWAGTSIAEAGHPSALGPQLGCIDTSAGTLTLIDASATCGSGLVPVVWQTTAPAKGAAGATGAKGATGARGATGATGADGTAGSTGLAGTKGAAGARGTTGAHGADGTNGAPGTNGTDGAPGTNGAAGATGATGPAAWATVSTWSGTAPYTAGPPSSVVTDNGAAWVAVASNLGEEPGTGTSWVMIAAAGEQGPTGDTGAIGPKGDTGATGPIGPKGDTGATGATGNSALSGDFGTGTGTAAAGNGAACTLGEVILSGANVTNGVPADGQLIDIANNSALYALYGITFGGNGTSTFGLPDLNAVAPNHLTYSICDNGSYPARR